MPPTSILHAKYIGKRWDGENVTPKELSRITRERTKARQILFALQESTDRKYADIKLAKDPDAGKVCMLFA